MRAPVSALLMVAIVACGPNDDSGDAGPSDTGGLSDSGIDGNVDTGTTPRDAAPDGGPDGSDAGPTDTTNADADLADADPADVDPTDVDPADVDPADAEQGDAIPGDLGPTGGAAACVGLGPTLTSRELTTDWYGQGAVTGPDSRLRALSSNGRTMYYESSGAQWVPFASAEAEEAWQFHGVFFDLHAGLIESHLGRLGPGALDGSGTLLARVSSIAGVDQIVVEDLSLGTIEVVSVSDASINGNGPSSAPSISADGNRIAFLSTSSNLIVGGNGRPNVYLRDRAAGTTVRVSTPIANLVTSPIEAPVISADGNVVAFTSASEDLVPGDDNGLHDVFVYDVPTAQLSRASLNAAGEEVDDAADRIHGLSADGNLVLFRSYAANLDPLDVDNHDNIFLKDRTTGSIERFLPETSPSAVISDDGRFVALIDSSFATLHIYDRANASELLVPALFDSIDLKMTGDGTLLAYASDRTVMGVRNGAAADIAPLLNCASAPGTEVDQWQWKAAPYFNYGRQGFSTTLAGDRVLIWGGNHFTGSFGPPGLVGLTLDTTSHAIAALPVPGANASGAGHTASWTGDELFVFGGLELFTNNYSAPARIDPLQLTSSPPSTTDRPSARAQHGAAWTGSQVFIWGGSNASGALDDGALWDPTSDTWTPISGAGAPSARVSPIVFWAGTGLIVYGGMSGTAMLADGALYDPLTDLWSPISTTDAVPGVAGAWTGSELFVWNGVLGGRYDPLTDTWTAVGTGGPTLDASNPIPRGFAITARPTRALVFTQTEAYGYNLVTNAWIPLRYPAHLPELSLFRVSDVVDLGGDLLLWADSAARFGPP